MTAPILALVVLLVVAGGRLGPEQASFADPVARLGLVPNGDLEATTGGSPSCVAAYGYGINTPSVAWVSAGQHVDGHAVMLTLTHYRDGDYKVMNVQSPLCAPRVDPGVRYQLGVSYRSTTSALSLTVFVFSARRGWRYWTELRRGLRPSITWISAAGRTPPVPPGVTALTFGISLAGDGSLWTDDYTLRPVTGQKSARRGGSK